MLHWLRRTVAAPVAAVCDLLAPSATPAPKVDAPSADMFGADGSVVEAFAFTGGGFDAVMQLGVVQALVLRAKADGDGSLPHAFAGVSSGAVMAAVAADILGQTERKGLSLTQARADRLRQVLQQFLAAPQTLVASMLPDFYEVRSKRPLRSLRLPIQNSGERKQRDDAVNARVGLIRLMNQLLSTSLPLAALTRLVRIGLGFKLANEERRRWRVEATPFNWRPTRLVRAGWEYARALGTLYVVFLRYGVHLSEIYVRLWAGYVRGGSKIIWDRITGRGDHGGSRKVFLATDAAGVLSMPRLAINRVLVLAVHSVAIVLWYGVLLGLLWGLVWSLSRIFLGIELTLPWQLPEGVTNLRPISSLYGILQLAAIGAPVYVPAFIALVSGAGLLRGVLRDLSLDRDLLSDYDLRRFLIQLLDPGYFRRVATTDEAIAYSLVDQGPSAAGTKKRLLHELSRNGRLHVAPVAANLGDGNLEILEDTTLNSATEQLLPTAVPVVDALMASTAKVPLFRTQRVEGHGDGKGRFLDGANIASEPLNGLMDYLKARVSTRAAGITVFAVTPFPVEQGTTHAGPVHGAVNVVTRVLDLRRYQAAQLERDLTDVYSKALGATYGVADRVADVVTETHGQRYVHATIKGIETVEPVRVYRKLAEAADEAKRHEVVFEAVAAGCLASIQAFRPAQIEALFAGGRQKVTCPDVMAGHSLFGGAEPGVPEICKHCKKGLQRPPSVKIPPPQEPPPGPKAPWATLLLSGGVFRGVFQVGVVAGCLEAGVKPRLLVGSSVGSLMTTAAARIWSSPQPDQIHHLRRLAGAFLGLDNLVMTDRFADVVRRFTLRAGYTDVSIKDVDRALRTYAEAGPAKYSRTFRRVLAGFERLFYITPFELLTLTRTSRASQWNRFRRQAISSAQNFLDRSGVADELLGSEPLQWLIDTLGKPLNETDPKFDCYSPDATPAAAPGVYRLVTATNLQAGKLEVFGEKAASGGATSQSFSETLLASSAFPLVFRPRLESDLAPANGAFVQYADGGVMDNLPLYRVAQFIADAAQHGKTVRRPAGIDNEPTPHLVITGSLEPEFSVGGLADYETQYWPSVQERARRIAHNTKALGFAEAQEHLTRIYEHRVSQTAAKAAVWQPVHLNLAVVRAKWLCSTFGFHPMLGFNRSQQARSIAHGCASTLAFLSLQKQKWASEWGLNFRTQPIRSETIQWTHGPGGPGARSIPTLLPRRLDAGAAPGSCWFRKDAMCPFSREAGAEAGTADAKSEWIARIYESCGKTATHREKGNA